MRHFTFDPQRFQQFPTRAAIEDEISRLIELLDELDPDPDLEEEPDLESYLAGALCGTGRLLDLEADDSALEPNLGWTGALRQHGPNWHGDNDDREFDGDDLEPDADAEAWNQPAHLIGGAA